MQEIEDVLASCRLFQGIPRSEYRSLLKCMGAYERPYQRKALIQCAGDEITALGLVMVGRVLLFQEDYWGKRHETGRLDVGEFWGEFAIAAKRRGCAFYAVAEAPSAVAWIDFERVFAPCTKSCGRHLQFIRNLVYAILEKNLSYTRKLSYLTCRSTREKLCIYLSEQARRAGGNQFEIPLNRQELAGYLACDRSAMSGELGRMRDEGLIEFDRNSFVLRR